MFKTKYNHVKPITNIKGVSMTEQQYRDECDIDAILKRYKVGQSLPTTARVGSYGDFTSFGDYQTCLNKIRQADEDFCSLPAVLRARFGNDPVAYYHFVLDPDNKEECIRLGLRVVPAAEKPIPVEVIQKPSSENPASTSAGSSAANT